jgi:hypothetical protein
MPQPSSSTTIRLRTPPAISRTVIWRGAGVQRVVHQLAHHRGRALHHLAGGDLADQFVGQFADRAARGGVRVRHSFGHSRGPGIIRRHGIVTLLIDFILHVDVHLEFVATYGAWVYALLFLIIFVETGLVVMPFLPGDSLLFVVGALCGAG